MIDLHGFNEFAPGANGAPDDDVIDGGLGKFAAGVSHYEVDMLSTPRGVSELVLSRRVLRAAKAEVCENCDPQEGVMRTASAIAGFVLTLSTTTAIPKDCKGISFPDHAVVEGTDLTLNGIGLHKATFLRVDVYVGALYVAVTSRDPNTLINSDRPQELILQFLRSVKVKDVRDQWTKDFVHVVPDRPASLMQRVATLNTWLSDLKSDQRLTFVRQPGEGIKVVVGGVLKGTVPGDDFSRVFMSIWLGAAPPSAGLRAGLLGGSCD